MRSLLTVTHAFIILLLWPHAIFAIESPLIWSAGRIIVDLQVEGAQVSQEEMDALVRQHARL